MTLKPTLEAAGNYEKLPDVAGIKKQSNPIIIQIVVDIIKLSFAS